MGEVVSFPTKATGRATVQLPEAPADFGLYRAVQDFSKPEPLLLLVSSSAEVVFNVLCGTGPAYAGTSPRHLAGHLQTARLALDKAEALLKRTTGDIARL